MQALLVFFCVFVGFNLGLKQICKVASGNLCMLSLLWPTSGVNNLMSSQTQSKLDFNISSFRYEFNIYVPGKKSQKNHLLKGLLFKLWTSVQTGKNKYLYSMFEVLLHQDAALNVK